MSARAARLLSLPFVVLAFLLQLVLKFWVQPLTWRMDSTAGSLVVAVVAFAATMVVPLGIYLLLIRRVEKQPAEWRTAFSVDALPRWAGRTAILIAWISGSAIPVEATPGTKAARLMALDPVNAVLLTFALLGLIVAVMISVSGRPALELRPDGITVRNLLLRKRTGWGGPIKIRPERLNIDRDFLDFTLWYYCAFPAARATIGTETGARSVEEAYRRRVD
ncbi:hypothetical protein [Actinoplanes sp. NPDC020271]|uniref:hypothetical protein n=1 Tax=Actinoplanes sp. NPDC020271 TaxID=3363896 RepID=UPI0037BD317B